MTDELERAPMKVGELIQRLEAFPTEAVIRTEGCDCYGDVRQVVFDEKEFTVYLNRCEHDAKDFE